MTLALTVHRGTSSIGGSCIELEASDGQRIILDAGRPLDAPREATGLLPTTLDTTRPATAIFSHAHMDHWGLIDELPVTWDIWAGSKSAELIRLTVQLFGGSISRPLSTWHSRSRTFQIGRFEVTPFLTDHSAPDAYMLLIEAEGKRVLYGGDFRVHGRKAKLVELMISSPPRDVDVLIMEGTNIGTDKPVMGERELEEAFVDLTKVTGRHVFVQWSAQNIDRTVTLYRAAKRTGRDLVVDLYGADVLRRIAEGTRLPVPGPSFPELKVLITPGGKRLYSRQGRNEFVKKMATSLFATSRARIADKPSIIMTRDSMLPDLQRGGLGFTPDDSYAFSNWSGYLDPHDETSGWAQAARAGARTEKLHTSGHASPADLSRFAAAIAPTYLVPVHGISWDNASIPLPPVKRLRDGERWTL